MKLIIISILLLFLCTTFSQKLKTYSFLGKVWSAENSTIKTYKNGDSIFFAKDSLSLAEAGFQQKGAWCYVNFDSSTEQEMGLLYNHFALTDSRGIAPEGWRLPMIADFEDLITAHGGRYNAGKRLLNQGSECGFNAIFTHGDQAQNKKILIWTNEQDGYLHNTFWFYYIEENYFNVSKHSFIPSEALQVRFIKEKITNESNENFNEIELGNQVWMSKNLTVKTFRNGDSIRYCNSKNEWKEANKNSEPAYCYYDFNPKNGEKYGFIYNKFVLLDKREVAPIGYDVPKKVQWEELGTFLKGNSKGYVAGNKMKNMGEWIQKDYCKTFPYNPLEFNALPGGFFSVYASTDMFNKAFFWTKDTSLSNFVLSSGYSHYQFDSSEDISGSYIRCIMSNYAYSNKNKEYKETSLGSLTFMDENLSSIFYRNGDSIPQARSKEEWKYFAYKGIGAWCYYEFDEVNKEKYGIIYNGFVIKDERGICPDGWRIPSKDEIATLKDKNKVKFENYLMSINTKGRVNIKSEFTPFPEWWMTFEHKKRFFYFSLYDGKNLTDGWSTSGTIGCYIKCIKEN